MTGGNEISKTLQNDIGIDRFKEVFMNNSNSKTAQILGIGVSTVSLYAKQLNITKNTNESHKKGGRPPKKTSNQPSKGLCKCGKAHDEIIESLYHNIKVSEIANKCKIDKGALYSYIQSKGGKVKLIEEYKVKKTDEVQGFYATQAEHGIGVPPQERFKVNEDEDMNNKFETFCVDNGNSPFIEKDLDKFYDAFVAENKLTLEDEFLSNFTNLFRTKYYLVTQNIIDDVFALFLAGVNREDIHNRTGYPVDDIEAIWARYMGDDERLQADSQRATTVLKEFDYSIEDTVQLTGLDEALVTKVKHLLMPEKPAPTKVDDLAEAVKNAPKPSPEVVELLGKMDDELEKELAKVSPSETLLERKQRIQAELAEVESQMASDEVDAMRKATITGLTDMALCVDSLEECTLESLALVKTQIESIENTFKASMQSYRQKLTNMSKRLS